MVGTQKSIIALQQPMEMKMLSNGSWKWIESRFKAATWNEMGFDNEVNLPVTFTS